MIKIENKKQCCGCSACVERCPKQCISFDEDKEGFRYPKVDESRCIHCNLCEKVCPVINTPKENPIIGVYAASSKDSNTKNESSSGAIFTSIANKILKVGGIVFGARYDRDWEVCHDYCIDAESLYKLRGSKYMQSRIGNNFKLVEQFLKEGKDVLFSGTPCQIAGLKTYLLKDYDNLTTVDVICHGVPSPKVWRLYLKNLLQKGIIGPSLSDITEVNFRAKTENWIKFQILIKSKRSNYVSRKDNDPYFRAFNMNVILRPICYECPFKCGKSGSNVTLADFWGIQKIDLSAYDEQGTSMVIIHSDFQLETENLFIKEEAIESIAKYNGSYYHSASYNGNRVVLFGKMESSRDISDLINRCTQPSKFQRIQNFIYRKFKRIMMLIICSNGVF